MWRFSRINRVHWHWRHPRPPPTNLGLSSCSSCSWQGSPLQIRSLRVFHPGHKPAYLRAKPRLPHFTALGCIKHDFAHASLLFLVLSCSAYSSIQKQYVPPKRPGSSELWGWQETAVRTSNRRRYNCLTPTAASRYTHSGNNISRVAQTHSDTKHFRHKLQLLPLVPILSHINSVHTTPSYLSKTNFNIIQSPTAEHTRYNVHGETVFSVRNNTQLLLSAAQAVTEVTS
jgi:hypothetical protein